MAKAVAYCYLVDRKGISRKPTRRVLGKTIVASGYSSGSWSSAGILLSPRSSRL